MLIRLAHISLTAIDVSPALLLEDTMAKLTFPDFSFTPYESMKLLSTAMNSVAKLQPDHRIPMADIIGYLILPLQNELNFRSGIPPWAPSPRDVPRK